jgi:hypothetical protein
LLKAGAFLLCLSVLDFFKKIIQYFDLHDIPYMLSGSIAMGIYVLPRATKDIDFVVHLQLHDISEFVKQFEGAYYCSENAVRDAVNRQSMFNVIDHASGFKADFVVLKDDVYRQTEFERKRKADFYGLSIWVVSPEDLIISKLIWIQQWQAALQMEDIKSLAAHFDLQKDYIDHWLKKLNLNTFDLLS